MGYELSKSQDPAGIARKDIFLITGYNCVICEFHILDA